jgi:hypothetical protein
MKLTIEELLRLSDEQLYDYIQEHKNGYTINELKELYKKREIKGYISANYKKDDITSRILYELSIKILNELLEPSESWKYIHIDKLMARDDEYKINFMRKYGKYLDENDVKRIISEECESTPPSYREILIELYISSKVSMKSPTTR